MGSQEKLDFNHYLKKQMKILVIVHDTKMLLQVRPGDKIAQGNKIGSTSNTSLH